jgi:hypothetical protein
MFLDALAVDPGAVAGTQIHHHIASFRATKFRMASGNLSVLQSDTVAGIPANRNYRTVQAKAFALQGPLHNDQCRRHRFPLIISEPCPPFSMHIFILIIAPFHAKATTATASIALPTPPDRSADARSPQKPSQQFPSHRRRSGPLISQPFSFTKNHRNNSHRTICSVQTHRKQQSGAAGVSPPWERCRAVDGEP